MKPTGQYWDNFKSLHSVATRMWVEENYQKAITKEQFIKEHRDTCMAKKHSYKYCGGTLYKYLTKYDWIKFAE